MGAHRHRMMMMPYPSEYDDWHGHGPPPDSDGMGGMSARRRAMTMPRRARSSAPMQHRAPVST